LLRAASPRARWSVSASPPRLLGLLADGYGLPAALCVIVAFPAACVLTFMLRDPRPRSDGTAPLT